MDSSMEHEYQRRLRGLKILRNLSEFLKELDVRENEILKNMLVKFSIEAIEADMGALLVYDPESEVLEYYTAYVYNGKHHVEEDYTSSLKNVRMRKGEGLAGFCLESRETLILDDITTHPHYTPELDELLPFQRQSAVFLPIIVGNEPVAVLEIANSSANAPLNATDLEILVIISNLSSAAIENARLFLWAISDPLTELFNIHFYKRTLATEMKRSERFGTVCCVVMIDFDNFKHINDTYGHPAGDRVLKTLATILRANLRNEIDVAARYGGDEFILLLPNTPASGARVVMGRILHIIRTATIALGTTRKISFSISAGIAASIEQGDTSEAIVSRADTAMYQAKTGGKNKVCTYGAPDEQMEPS